MTARPTVFIVDDDPAVRDSLGLSLRAAGFDVTPCACAEDFLRIYRPEQRGCVLLDIRMPGMSGIELQEHLGERGLRIPIVFITGHGDIPTSVRAIKRGAVDFLEKPFSREDLIGRIEEALEQDALIHDKDDACTAILARFQRLTPREREVMGLVVSGKANKVIARELGMSYRTVETHRARVMEKMHADSLVALVDMAIVCGIHQAGRQG